MHARPAEGLASGNRRLRHDNDCRECRMVSRQLFYSLLVDFNKHSLRCTHEQINNYLVSLAWLLEAVKLCRLQNWERERPGSRIKRRAGSLKSDAAHCRVIATPCVVCAVIAAVP